MEIPQCREGLKAEEKERTENEKVGGITDSKDMSLCKLLVMVKDRVAGPDAAH